MSNENLILNPNPTSTEVLAKGFSRRTGLLVLGTTVVLSFVVGIVIGLSRGRVQEALAARAVSYTTRELLPAPTMHLTPIGAASKTTGVDSEMASFTSPASVEDLLVEQEKVWKTKGLITSRHSSGRRGVALAYHRDTKERYITSAFFCPLAIRARVCDGQNVFGITTYLSGENPQAVSENVVPRCAGMKNGSSFETFDFGRPSVTLTGVCPQGLQEAANSFRAALESAGWSEVSARDAGSGEAAGTVLMFSREGEEISVILSEARNSGRSFAVVTKHG